ncbi:hypothetical protein DXF96_16520 [Heyndrickxia coagulans]|uniref:Uncharacterized protein n=1 Tax=Heyndrickxia coagulans TaxID=1398 RepID=A0AAN0T5D3_HEYCO|nr:hypothetical protein SB48_HM08orf02511 [Heyndrickxia coagulans]KGT39884.1 hypothetical protein P421_02210 [Heyndrickxia coagulans P38]APB36613.1 hypothetical protein BIZ35_07020 [Heyndrickxia coagulans]ATW82717.1 hypothetical protein CIW84_06940 [Heyndrickxia coagulans]AVD56630.1 hypothetical protein C3766_10980 [Heyndrickxia coagulans]
MYCIFIREVCTAAGLLGMIATVAGKSRFFYFVFFVSNIARLVISRRKPYMAAGLLGRPLQSRVRAGFYLFFF